MLAEPSPGGAPAPDPAVMMLVEPSPGVPRREPSPDLCGFSPGDSFESEPPPLPEGGVCPLERAWRCPGTGLDPVAAGLPVDDMLHGLLIRPINLATVAVALPTGAVVQARLGAPMHVDDFHAYLLIKPAKPLPVRIRLGPYDIERRAFVDCVACAPNMRHTLPPRKDLKTPYRRTALPPDDSTLA